MRDALGGSGVGTCLADIFFVYSIRYSQKMGHHPHFKRQGTSKHDHERKTLSRYLQSTEPPHRHLPGKKQRQNATQPLLRTSSPPTPRPRPIFRRGIGAGGSQTPPAASLPCLCFFPPRFRIAAHRGLWVCLGVWTTIFPPFLWGILPRSSNGKIKATLPPRYFNFSPG